MMKKKMSKATSPPEHRCPQSNVPKFQTDQWLQEWKITTNKIVGGVRIKDHVFVFDQFKNINDLIEAYINSRRENRQSHTHVLKTSEHFQSDEARGFNDAQKRESTDSDDS